MDGFVLKIKERHPTCLQVLMAVLSMTALFASIGRGSCNQPHTLSHISLPIWQGQALWKNGLQVSN
jgi:hypothetical protein